MKKKLATMALAATLAVSVLGTNPVWAAKNNNHSDTTYTYNFSEHCPYQGWHTSPRKKLDDTSSYMKCKKTTYGYTGTVKGSNGDNYEKEVNSPSYYFKSGTTKFMINYVYEKGYPYAVINAAPDVQTYFTATGVWSPDSI